MVKDHRTAGRLFDYRASLAEAALAADAAGDRWAVVWGRGKRPRLRTSVLIVLQRLVDLFDRGVG